MFVKQNATKSMLVRSGQPGQGPCDQPAKPCTPVQFRPWPPKPPDRWAPWRRRRCRAPDYNPRMAGLGLAVSRPAPILRIFVHFLMNLDAKVCVAMQHGHCRCAVSHGGQIGIPAYIRSERKTKGKTDDNYCSTR